MSSITIPQFDKLISGNGTKANMGDTGAVYTAKINDSFAKIKLTTEEIDALLISMAEQMATFITAGVIKSLSVTTDGILQYSTDGVSYQDCIEWGKIRGKITDQRDLKTLLDEKATNVTVAAIQSLIDQMQNQINENTTGIAENKANIENNKDSIDNINVDINSINNQLLLRVLGNGIRQIRVSGGQFQYSTSDPAVPNPQWISVSDTVQISWGNLIGDITDQEDLKGILKDKADAQDIIDLTQEDVQIKLRLDSLESNIGGFTLQAINDILTDHITNENNPHHTTKEHVGLGNVDNTSDADKPVSTAQQQSIDTAKQEVITETNKVQTNLTHHIDDTDNPHSVTKEQIGLRNVDNTSDLEKPVSNKVKDILSQYVLAKPNTEIMIVSPSQFEKIDKKPTALYVVDENIEPENISYDNIYVSLDNQIYTRPFDISISKSQVESLRILSYIGWVMNISILYNNSTLCPESGEVEIKCKYNNTDEAYNQSEIILGTLRIGG